MTKGFAVRRRCTIQQTYKKGIQCKSGCSGLLVVLHSAAWFFGANLWGLCGTRGCVGSLDGCARDWRVFAFAMYKVGLAAPQHYWVLSDLRCGIIWNWQFSLGGEVCVEALEV